MARVKKKQLPASSIVTQANGLVMARYSLPLVEQRLILTMIARIQPDDEDFKPYRISVGELADFIGVARGSAYRECKKITENLLSRVLTIDEPDGVLQVSWVSAAKYIDGAGMVNLSFDPSLKPYLLQLKGNFTSCKLEMLLSFKSQYTMRMYNLLKQYEWRKEREIDLDVLRDILGIKDQYKLYADFKRTILDLTQKELTEKADFYFNYEEIKYGRRVGAIRFHIHTQDVFDSTSKVLPEPLSYPELPSPSHSNFSGSVEELLLLVPEQHRAKKTIHSALVLFESRYDIEYVRRNILYANFKAEKSYAGFLNNALKEDWGHDWELEQKVVSEQKKTVEIWARNGFNNQKEYDDFMYQKQMEGYGQREIFL